MSYAWNPITSKLDMTGSGGGGGGMTPANVLVGYTSEDDDNGIRAVIDGSNVIVELTNRLFGTGTSEDGSAEDLITFDLGDEPACYRFNFSVTSLSETGDGMGYNVDGTIKTDGSIATIVAMPYSDDDEDPDVIDSNIDIIADDNNMILRVNGVMGEIINYKAVGQYVRIG